VALLAQFVVDDDECPRREFVAGLPIPHSAIAAIGQSPDGVNSAKLFNDFGCRGKQHGLQYIPNGLEMQQSKYEIYGVRNLEWYYAATMDDQGSRLLRLREAMGISTQTAMAVALGIEVSRWNNFERSHSPLSLDVANRICARFPGVTLDWLIRGNPSGLPLDLAKRLGELPSANPSRRRRR
jgi:hypothetical protein